MVGPQVIDLKDLQYQVDMLVAISCEVTHMEKSTCRNLLHVVISMEGTLSQSMPQAYKMIWQVNFPLLQIFNILILNSKHNNSSLLRLFLF